MDQIRSDCRRRSDLQTSPPTRAHKVCIVAYPGVNLLDVSGPAQVFSSDIINEENRLGYEVVVASPKGGNIKTDASLDISTIALSKELLSSMDTVLIAGGRGIYNLLGNKQLINLLADAAETSHRFGSICMGAYLLAATGLVDKKRITTHWSKIDELQSLYPSTIVENGPIFIKEGKYWTSAGITTGIDMSLAIVEEDNTRLVSLSIAKDLVVFSRRDGSQTQNSFLLDLQSTDIEGRFDRLHQWLTLNLKEEINVGKLAEYVSMSPRNFTRVYGKAVGITPMQAVEGMRIEHAKYYLANTDAICKTIATLCGFQSEEQLRRVFVRLNSISPQEFRVEQRSRRGLVCRSVITKENRCSKLCDS